METRALLAFLISVAILVGYQILFAPAPNEPAPSGVVEQQADPTRREADSAEAAAPVAVERPRELTPPGDEQLIVVDTQLYTATFTSFGGRLKHFKLKEHRLTAEPDSEPLDMVVSSALLPLGVYWKTPDGGTVSDARVMYEVRADRNAIAAGETATVTMTGASADGTRIIKTLTLRGDSYVLSPSVRVEAARAPAIGVSWTRDIPKVNDKSAAGLEGPVAYADAALHAHAATNLAAAAVHEGAIDWAGYADHYFLAAYYPEERRALRFIGAAADQIGEMILWDDAAAGQVSYNLFVGPKSIRLLGSLGHNLQEAIDLGYFAVVARPLLELMIFLHRFIGNYGWAIVILTFGIRVVFYPINKRQLEAMKAMQRIQPELKRIQEKYKDDREQLNKEMIEVYRRHKVNPLGGCLPMLLQLPVFLGLYNALMQAIELRHAPFIGWIRDLSQPDRLGTLPIPFVSPPGIPVMTLLMGLSMLVQQKMTPSTADPVQQRMMMILPLVFTVMFINFPAGLVLYWFSNNVLSIAQQQLMTRAKS